MIELPDSNFLLPDATALIEAVVFLVVLVVVSKFVLPRLHTVMTERRRQIDDALHRAAEAEAGAKARHDDAASTLRAARRQARLIIDSAYERHDHLVAEGRRKGREEYEWSTRKLVPHGAPSPEQPNGSADPSTMTISTHGDSNIPEVRVG